MRVYGLKSCDTCRKAMKSLDNFSFVDVRADGVPPDLLGRAYEQFGEKLINSRSTTWRGLSESERAMPPLELLARHPALMKRPLIETADRLWLGWDAVTRAGLGVE